MTRFLRNAIHNFTRRRGGIFAVATAAKQLPLCWLQLQAKLPVPLSFSSTQAGTAAPLRSLFVKRDGDLAWVEVSVPLTGDVEDLTKAIKAKLMLQVPNSAISLHRAEMDENGRVDVVEDSLLLSNKTVSELSVRNYARLVVRVWSHAQGTSNVAGTAGKLTHADADRFEAALTSAKIVTMEGEPVPEASGMITDPNALPWRPRVNGSDVAVFAISEQVWMDNADAPLDQTRLFHREIGTRFIKEILHDFTFSKTDTSRHIKAGVVGAPGTGLSYFAQRVCSEARQKQFDVIYLRPYTKGKALASEFDAFLISDQGCSLTQDREEVIEFVRSRADKNDMAENVVLVADCVNVPDLRYYKCRVELLVTSPNPDVYYSFTKFGPLYALPTLSLRELYQLGFTCGAGNIDFDSLSSLIESHRFITGNTLCGIFCATDLEESRDAILATLNRYPTEQFLEAALNLALTLGINLPHGFHSLLHVTEVDHRFKCSKVDVASPFVRELVMRKLQTFDAAQRAKYLCLFKVNPQLSNAAGWLFEPHAIDHLRHGGRFTIWKLADSSKNEILELPPLEIYEFKDLDSLWLQLPTLRGSKREYLLIPEGRNWTGIGSFATTKHIHNYKLQQDQSNLEIISERAKGQQEGLAPVLAILEWWHSTEPAPPTMPLRPKHPVAGVTFFFATTEGMLKYTRDARIVGPMSRADFAQNVARYQILIPTAAPLQ